MKKLFTLAALALPILSIAQKPTSAEIARYQQQARAVTIIRDNYGTPHIYSKTDAGVVFGLMYTQCEENFKGIERNYLYQLGRQSEADGATPLYTDVQLQLIADSADAIKDYNNSAPSFKKLLDAFADGVNYYLYKHPEVKPMVFKKFKPWFPLMFTDGSVAATETGDITPKETQAFYGDAANTIGAVYSPESIINTHEERETGSNGFAISPSRTASGHAMLYINPHVPFYFRSEVGLLWPVAWARPLRTAGSCRLRRSGRACRCRRCGCRRPRLRAWPGSFSSGLGNPGTAGRRSPRHWGPVRRSSP